MGWSAYELASTLDVVRETRRRATEQIAPIAPGEKPSIRERSPLDEVYPAREGGVHAHKLGDDGSAELGGRHGHAILYRGAIWFSELDGAHAHGAGEDGAVDEETDHVHKLYLELDDETTELELGPTSSHTHEELVNTTVLDGVHQHEVEINGRAIATLLPAEFRELFGVAEALRFAGEAREAVGQAVVPTGGKSLAEWWGSGYGSPAVRKYLASWVSDTVIRATESDGNVRLLVPSSELGDSSRWIILDGAVVVSEVEADLGEMAARESATLALTVDRPRISVAERTFETVEENEVCECRLDVELVTDAPDPEAVESAVLSRAVESLIEPYIGRVVESVAGDDRAWDLQIMEFGISDNDNFWPRSMADDLLRALEGAPLEAIEYRPHHFDHLPLEAVLRFPKGIVLNTVGQGQKMRVIESGGRAPTGRKLKAIMDRMGMSKEEVLADSVGSILGVGFLDGDRGGEAIHEKLRSAEARGRLLDYLGVSVDFQDAPFVPIFVPGLRRPIIYRTGVNSEARRSISFVTHPSAGGRVRASAA
jgi:hypothetical protein